MKRQRAAPNRAILIFGIVGDIIGTGVKEEYANERQEDQQQFNAAEASIQRQWAEHMQNTQYQRMTKDLEAANLNPILAYSKLAGGVPSVSAATSGIAGSGGGTNIQAGLQSAAQTAVLDATEARVKAETDKIKAEEENIRAQTPTHAVNIDRMKQEIEESQERIKRIIEETKHHASSAKHLDQQVTNLQETIPQLRANVDQLKALTAQHQALTGLTKEQTAEVKQRVGALLPQLEAKLKELERQSRLLAIPGMENNAAAQDSFLGQLSAYLRMLNPFSGILGAVPVSRAPTPRTVEGPIHRGTGGNPTIHRR